MESALTPREIQNRIRGGMALDEVAAEAGVTVERIELFAGPILAERENAADLARQSGVRRKGESTAHRTLGEVVAQAVQGLGLDPDEVAWDAWRNQDRRWTVQVVWTHQDTTTEAHFRFDMRARVSTPDNDEAARLLSARSRQAGQSLDGEPTVDLRDQVAIVKAVQDDTRPPAVVADDHPEPEAPDPDDYAPAEFAQVDGVFDIVSNPQGDMDVLYDMLAGFNEDSVRIYTGLTKPVTASPEGYGAAEQPTTGQEDKKSDQEPLVDEGPRPAKPKNRRRRASVPSWDEIVFGSPKNQD